MNMEAEYIFDFIGFGERSQFFILTAAIRDFVNETFEEW